MKKLLTTLLLLLLLLLFVVTTAISQEAYFITFGFDPKLAIKGAYKYDETSILDVSFKTGTRLKGNWEVGVGAEYAQLNPSYLAGKLYVNKVFFNWRETLAIAVGAEFVTIQRGRYGDNKKINAQGTFGLNAETRFFITPNTSIDFALGFLHRKDLLKMYNDKVFFKINGTISITFQTQR